MAKKAFDRDAKAKWYVRRHLNSDPGITQLLYLPTNAPPTEIRLLEVNELIAERTSDLIEPIDFGVEIGPEATHCLMVVDVTPAQWDRIQRKEIELPEGWSLESAMVFQRQKGCKTPFILHTKRTKRLIPARIRSTYLDLSSPNSRRE